MEKWISGIIGVIGFQACLRMAAETAERFPGYDATQAAIVILVLALGFTCSIGFIANACKPVPARKLRSLVPAARPRKRNKLKSVKRTEGLPGKLRSVKTFTR